MNADRLIFNSIFPVAIVIAVALLLGAFFIWKEFQRKHRYIALRIIAQLVIVFSLTALFLRPSIKVEKTVGSALLLTQGYDKKSADSLVDKFALRIIRAFDAASYPKSEVLSSWHSLQADAKDIRFVLGEGIPSAALEEYDLHFDYLKGKTPVGITQVNNEPFKSNQVNLIKGEINHDGPATLKLIGPGGAEDSVQLQSKGNVPFSLSAFAKQEGKFIYELKLTADGKLIESQKLPIEVLPEKKLNVLFVQQYPTFEARYLKNYLGEKGHAVIMRYQVSKNIFKYEYANKDKVVMPKLSEPILNALDLLITTPEALKDLSASELQVLETSVKKGLGLLLIFSQPVKNLQKFFPYELTAVNTDTVSLASAQWKGKLTLPATPLRVNESPAVIASLKDKNKKTLSGYFYTGAGKTGFQFLNETYRLMLEGKQNEYASLWSPLIEGTARKNQDKFKVHLTSPFPLFAEQPIHFEVISSSTEIPAIRYDSILIPLQEHVGIDQVWNGTIWTSHSGWQQLNLPDSSHFNFYVFGEGEWSTLHKMNLQHKNETYKAITESASSVITAYRPISLLFLFLLFVIASGTLWLLAKL